MKTKTILLFSFLLILTSFNQLSAQDFYLHANGVTCMCPDAAVGDSGIVNGITYTKRTAEQITTTNASTTCTSGITDMSNLFYDESNFNENISSWDVSNVMNMGSMFYYNSSFNQDIGIWDVSNVTNMASMLQGASSFNQDIGDWDVSNVQIMAGMFKVAISFNQDIGNWDVSNVQGMFWMFQEASLFNQDIGNWNVSNVWNINGMFLNATSFNQDIGNWNVSNVQGMSWMFKGATSFNQDIGNWDVSNVDDMHSMFYQAISFNQDLSNWQFNTSVLLVEFVYLSDLDVANYEALLQTFDDQNLVNKTLLADGLYYCDDTARTNLINNRGWTIVGDIHGLFVCVEDAFRGTDEIDNTYTVVGDEFDPTDYCFDTDFTMTNDYNNLPTLDGEIFTEGIYTINWTATDTNNNTASCSFVLTIDPELANEDFNLASIVLYPNPTNTIVKLSNPQAIDLESIFIYDLTGRLIKNVTLDSMGTEVAIDVSSFANGTYLAIIKSADRGSLSKQLVVIN